MKGADVFAQCVESGRELDNFRGFEVIKRVVNPKGANGWEIVKLPIRKQFGKGISLGAKGLRMMLRSYLFLSMVNIFLFIKS